MGFLLATRDTEVDRERPIAGGDVRALQALAEFAVDLVGRGRVLPGVRDAGDGRAKAMWSAVVTGADAVWLRGLAAGLPGSFTASCPAGVDRSAAMVRSLAAATDALVDVAVRTRLGPVPRRRAVASQGDLRWSVETNRTSRHVRTVAGIAASIREFVKS